jgi:addiction module RelE/StbE family toxin
VKFEVLGKIEHQRTFASGGGIRELGRRKLPQEILERYEKWKDIVQISGPSGLRLIRGFHDEPLHGEWKGHRSSRLGEQYRVIYRVEKEEFFVLVVEPTAHDYRRK